MAVADKAAAVVPGGTVTGVMDGPGHLSQDSAMNTELAKRMEAHRAACQDIAQDPLVALELADRETARRVWANWKANREKPLEPRPVETVTPFVLRRQAE